MKKILCALLALLMLTSVVACANTGNTDDTTAANTTGASDPSTPTAPADTTGLTYTVNLPNVKYDGYEFIIANAAKENTKYTYSFLTAEDQNADPLNDATYKRTVKVQEQFGVKIVDEKVSTADLIVKLGANDDYYGFATADLSNVMNVVNKGYAENLYDIDSIELDKPWWDQNAEDKLSFGGKLYYTFSDATIYAMDNTRAVYFNKNLISDLNLENPHQLVENNQWTIEKMQEMAKAALLDEKGDSIWDESDRYGLVGNNTTFYEAMLTGCDAEIMKQGADGNPYFFCLDNKEKFVEVYDKLLNVFSNDNVFQVKAMADAREIFANGHSLFLVDTLYEASVLRKLDIEFGILPMPKYVAEQETYLHVSPNPHGILIPTTNSDATRTGVLLEAMSYYSSKYYADDALIPAYYDITLLGRAAKDEASAESLQIIHDNISYVIKIVGTQFSNSVFAYFEGKQQISNLIAKQETSLRKLLADTLTKLTQ